MGSGVDDVLLSTASGFLGCKVQTLPLKYLGLPLCNKKLFVSDWNPVVERVHRRLALCKGPLLSSTGRLTLVKSTLSSIPLLYMSVFALPTQVHQKIEGLMRVS